MATVSTFAELVNIPVGLINSALPVLGSMAILVFLWGLGKFLFRVSGDEKAIAEGKNFIKWGLIALFILLSYMGIIKFFYTDIGFTGFGFPFLP